MADIVEIAEMSSPGGAEPDPLAGTRAFLMAAARDAESNAPPLPSDLAENHDVYAHGKPRNFVSPSSPSATAGSSSH